MGDKIEAKKIEKENGLPVIEGSENEVASAEQAKKISNTMGYPVLIKAAGGGGGKGMKVVNNADEVEKLFIEDITVLGRSNQELHIDSLFESGGGNGSWCMPFDQQAAFYFSYSSGILQHFDQDFSQGYLRPVRLYSD
jgi:hypothetical protein